MYIPDSHPYIGIDVIPSDLEEQMLHEAATEVSYFMRDVVQSHYIDDLGLQRIDPDPEPATPQDIEWRMGRIQSALAEGRQYMIARYLTGAEAADPQTALAGLLVTTPVEGQPNAIEIQEWDIARSERGTGFRRGLGSVMLRHKMQDVRDGADVVLDVAEPNANAIAIYRRYGFRFYAEPVRHNVFDVQHLPMVVGAAVLKKHLGVQ